MKDIEKYYIGPVGLKEKVLNDIFNELESVLSKYLFMYNNENTRNMIIVDIMKVLGKYKSEGYIDSSLIIDDKDIEIN